MAKKELLLFKSLDDGSNKKNSLINSINKKKKAGTSKSKTKSTISKNTYDDMEVTIGVIKNNSLNN